jgi:translation elongation factor EF-Ts
MEISLEKIDTIRERTGLSYKDAKEILEKHNGSVVEALIDIEENQGTWSENISSKGDVIIDKLKEALRKGNVTKITIKKDGEIIVNIPVTAGVIGALLAAPMAAFGLTAAVLAKCSIEITKEDGEVVDINSMAEKTVDKVKKAVKREDKNGANLDNDSEQNIDNE